MFDELTNQDAIDLAYEIFGYKHQGLNMFLGNIRKEVVERELGRKVNERLNDSHVLEAFKDFDEFDKAIRALSKVKTEEFIKKVINDEKTYCARVAQDLIKMGVDKSISDKFDEKFDMLCECRSNDTFNKTDCICNSFRTIKKGGVCPFFYAYRPYA